MPSQYTVFPIDAELISEQPALTEPIVDNSLLFFNGENTNGAANRNERVPLSKILSFCSERVANKAARASSPRTGFTSLAATNGVLYVWDGAAYQILVACSSGTTAARDTLTEMETAQVWINTDTQETEYYTGSAWARLSPTEQLLTIGANITYDVDVSRNARCPSPGSGNEFDNLTNAVEGDEGSLKIQGGANNPTWGAAWDFGDQDGWTLTTSATEADIVTWRYANSGDIHARVAQGFQW